MAKIGFEGHTRHSHSQGDQQPADVGGAQRPQQLDPPDRHRAEKRFGRLHVPDQHRTHDQPG